MRIRNLYVREPFSADENDHGAAISISVTQNASVENCYISEGVDGVNIKGSASASGTTGINVSDCTITRISNGVKPSVQGPPGFLNKATVLRNRIDELDVWSNYTGAGGHHHNDGIQTILGQPGTRSFSITVAYNHIGPKLGTAGHTTGAIFLEDDAEECYVYNNFIELAAGHWTSNSLIQAVQGAGWTPGEGPGLIANNTVLNHGSGALGIGSVHHSIIGNVISNIGLFISRGDSTGDSDYNVHWGPSGDRDGRCYDGATTFGSLANWQSIKGQDRHSINADPKLNPNGTLQAGSPAIGLAPSQAAIFTDDFFGNPRTGTWDAGAFEFGGSIAGGGGSTPGAPAPPTPTPAPSPGSTPTSPGSTPTSPGGTPTAPPTLGALVAAFGFDESSGGSVFDASGNANTGTITGAMRTPGKFGNSLNFDGTSNLVRVNGSVSLNLSSAMTLEAWVKPTAPQDGWRTILQRETVAYFLHTSHDTGTLRPATGAIFNGGQTWFPAPNTIPVNNWTHLASTYDGATLRLYVNGNPVASRTVTGSVETNSNPLWIGGNKPYGEFFQGQIDEVRIYNRALSGTEIKVDMDTPVGGVPASTPAPTSTPSPPPASALPAVDEPFAAASVPLTPPFAVTDGYVSQPNDTGLANGGRVSYEFTVPEHGEYAVVLVVDAADTDSNSLYLNVDAEPEDPVMISDIPVTSGFQTRTASWRGGGTPGDDQFVPKYFLLSPGRHELNIRGREGNTKFKTITIVKRP